MHASSCGPAKQGSGTGTRHESAGHGRAPRSAGRSRVRPLGSGEHGRKDIIPTTPIGGGGGCCPIGSERLSERPGSACSQASEDGDYVVKADAAPRLVSRRGSGSLTTRCCGRPMIERPYAHVGVNRVLASLRCWPRRAPLSLDGVGLSHASCTVPKLRAPVGKERLRNFRGLTPVSFAS